MLICISDGSYIPQLDPTICSTAIIMECALSRGHLFLSFTECSTAANAFQGELLGLVVIQLLLHSMDLSHPNLTGSVKVYSDCKGALTTISSLPCAQVSSSWTRRYFENHCSALSLLPIQMLNHMKAHQDDRIDGVTLDQPAQLECACDAAAKSTLLEASACIASNPGILSLEPMSLVWSSQKLTSDTSGFIWFLTHKKEAHQLYTQ